MRFLLCACLWYFCYRAYPSLLPADRCLQSDGVPDPRLPVGGWVGGWVGMLIEGVHADCNPMVCPLHAFRSARPTSSCPRRSSRCSAFLSSCTLPTFMLDHFSHVSQLHTVPRYRPTRVGVMYST